MHPGPCTGASTLVASWIVGGNWQLLLVASVHFRSKSSSTLSRWEIDLLSKILYPLKNLKMGAASGEMPRFIAKHGSPISELVEQIALANIALLIEKGVDIQVVLLAS